MKIGDMRYIGDVVDIKPDFDDVNIIWIKREDMKSINTQLMISSPAMWIEWEGFIYFGICDSYHFNFLEDFSDWDNFDEYDPGYLEFLHMMNLKPTFYKLDYLGVMESDLDDWCKFELDFIKEWWRNKQINEVINGN
jgi:hypothetical protein